MKLLALILALLIPASMANAVQIEVTVTASGPLGLAPAYSVFHDGSFDFFDPGTAASAALEGLAELGNTSGYAEPNGQAIAPGGPFTPGGGTASQIFTLGAGETYFSVAAMILPSNDWFIGNASAIDISALLAAPGGTTQSYDFATIWDAGTENEDFAFAPGGGLVGISTPSNPMGGTDQNGVVSAVVGADPFSSFLNLQPATFDTTIIDPGGRPIATVTLSVVPEPATAMLLGAALLGLGAVARRRPKTLPLPKR